MTCLCPTCGHETIQRAPIEGLTSAPLGRVERRIVEALARAYPGHISSDRLIDIIYGDKADGGPDNPRVIISVTMIRLRRKLPAFGWTIPKARSGPGTEGYHLEPIA